MTTLARILVLMISVFLQQMCHGFGGRIPQFAHAVSAPSYESALHYLKKSKLFARISSRRPSSVPTGNHQLSTDLLVFILCELFSKRMCMLMYHLDELIFKQAFLRQKPYKSPYKNSMWFFVEERGHAVGRLFMWNFFAKCVFIALSKLGFRVKADFPLFLSKFFFILFSFSSVDKLKRKFVALSFPGSDSKRQVYVFNKFSSFLLNTVGVFVACESVASYLCIPLSSLLAFGGVGGLTLGLSVKGVVGNFLGGLLLLVNEPFTPGDVVQFRSGTTSRDKDLIGRVEYVGWGQTQIRGNDTRPTYVPNAHFVSIPVTNIDRITHRKYETKVSLSFEDFASMPAVVEAIKSKFKRLPKVDILSQPFRVSFTEITPLSLDIEVLCYFATKVMDEFLRLQELANFAILDAVQENNCSFALPSNQVVFVDDNRKELAGFQIKPSSLSDSEVGSANVLITEKMVSQIFRDSKNSTMLRGGYLGDDLPSDSSFSP